MSAAKIETLYISPTDRISRVAVPEAILVAGRGIVGDRYFMGKGAFSEWSQQEFTLIEAEAIETVKIEYGLELTAGETQGNVITRGVSLNALIGQLFRIGDSVLCRGTRFCHPCTHLEVAAEGEGFAPLGGLRARILVGGTIREGDRLDIFDMRERIRYLAASADAAYNTEQ